MKMVELSRTVRFSVSLTGEPTAESPRHNTFAGWPSPAGLAAYYELEVSCRGRPAADTGYLTSITTIDEGVRSHALPLIQEAVISRPDREPTALLQEIAAVLDGHVGAPLAAVRWHLTPYYSLAMETATRDIVLVRQQFEFAAAHRLHCAELSDDDNHAIFGKCNNEHGHGHNYRIEVVVATPLASADGHPSLRLPQLEAIVDRVVIDRFDHTHLNLDTPDFDELNPSVEHIACVCYGLLSGPIDAAGGELREVTVWETDRTSCTYPA